MKYTTEVIINAPRDKVIALFDNPDNMSKWQPTLVSFESLSGEPGQPGAKSKLVYKMGSRNIEMIETVTTRQLPEAFHGTYESSGVYNVMENYFIEEGNRTRWRTESEFKFSGFMKIISFFMRQATFQKQTVQTMNDFKQFVERSGA